MLGQDDGATASGINIEIAKTLRGLRDMTARYRKMTGGHPPALFDRPGVTPPQSILNDCRVVRDRIELLRRLPKGGRFAEVGTLYGDFAVQVLEIVRPDEMLIFDISCSQIRSANRQKLEAIDTKFYEGLSWETLAAMPAQSFDVVYIDADHSYDAVTKDLKAALVVTKPGGYIVCNDYTGWSQPQCIPYGVFSAVNTFAAENRLQFEYLALQINGFYDVALRVPH